MQLKLRELIRAIKASVGGRVQPIHGDTDMGVTITLMSIKPGALEALRASPSIMGLLCEVDGELGALQMIAKDLAAGSEPQLDADPAELRSFLLHPALMGFDCCIGSHCGLDKSWAGIHHLLTGKDPFSRDVPRTPLEWAVLGDTILERTLYTAEPRALTAKQVREVTHAVTAVSIDRLRERYDPRQMTARDIYPRIWSDPDAWDWLAGYYEQLLAFYKETSEAGDAVICFTTV